MDQSAIELSALSRSNKLEDDDQNTKSTYAPDQKRRPTQSRGNEKRAFQSTETQTEQPTSLGLSQKTSRLQVIELGGEKSTFC